LKDAANECLKIVQEEKKMKTKRGAIMCISF